MKLTKKELDIIRKYYDDTNVSRDISCLDEDTLFEVLVARFGKRSVHYGYRAPMNKNGTAYVGYIKKGNESVDIREVVAGGYYYADDYDFNTSLLKEVQDFLDTRIPRLNK